MNQSYLCIDLKSYYASVECVDRGLDPFTANLVVADRARGMGALCLAVSPALKALGVRNRCRLFEIPRGIPYLIAPPLESMYALDKALKAAQVRVCAFYGPPSPTNFGGALLTGSQSDCQAACDAFARAVIDVAANPIETLSDGASS